MQERFKDAALAWDSFEAYINARDLVLAVQKAGSKTTGERMAEAIGNLGKVDLQGFRLAFGPDAKAASSFTDLVMSLPSKKRPFIR